MGRSWVLTIDLEVPDARRWRATTPNPSAFDDWPPLLETSARATKLSTLLNRLAKDAFARVSWEGNTLHVAALLSNDGSFWADARTALAAAVRTSEGVGEMAIVNADDNTEDTAIVVTTKGVEVLTGKRRTALAKRLQKVEQSIAMEAIEQAEGARRLEPIVRDERLRPVHAEVLRALKDVSEKDLLAAAANITEWLSLVPASGAPPSASFGALFLTKPALLAALEHGDTRVHTWAAGQFVAAALSILDQVAPIPAAALAAQALAARARHPSSLALLDVALDVVSRAEKDDTSAALRRLRKTLPPAAQLERTRIAQHPVVVRLARARSAEALAAVMLAVAKVIGSPGAWKTISEKDASFGYALLHLLEAFNAKSEAKALRTHPHWMIASAP